MPREDYLALLMCPPENYKDELAQPDAKYLLDKLPTCKITGRPLYQGMPVPWIAIWSGEKMAHAMSMLHIDGQMTLAYGDPRRSPFGVDAAMKAQRDEHGLLWCRDAPNREGWGEPQLANMHTVRSRDSFLKRLCQVCGRKLPDGETLFLAPTGDRENWRGRSFVVYSPPLCETCIQVSLRHCPAQKKSPRSVIHAYSYRPQVVLADVIGPFGYEDSAEVELDDPVLRRSIVRQLYCLVTDYDEEFL